MSERGIWARIFNENGYSIERIINMDDFTFQQLVNFYLDSGLQPDEEAPSDFLKALGRYKPNQHNSNDYFQRSIERTDSQNSSLKYSFNFSSQGSYDQSESALIQQDQNEQYVVTLSKMQQLERDSQLRKAEEERKLHDEIVLQISKLDAAKKRIIDKARQIPKEPEIASNNADVISISVILPGGRRVLRRFSSSELAESVYSWVSCFEELFDPIDESVTQFNEELSSLNNKELNQTDDDVNSTNKEDFLINLEQKIRSLGMPIAFRLILPPQVVIDEKRTLSEQNIGKRALFNVVQEE